MPEFAIPRSVFSPMEGNSYYHYVKLTYSVWPQIYGEEKPILFPTKQAAIKFAKGNVSSKIVRARAYSPDHSLLAEYAFA